MSVVINQERSKVAEIHQRLVQQVESFVASEDWRSFLNVAARFHRYSANNVMLILSQSPYATNVASFTTWKSLGRAVKKGEKGIRILAPCRYRVEDSGGGAVQGTNRDQWRLRGFKVVHVFDVSQTEGQALPTTQLPRLLEGEAPVGMWDTLCRMVRDRGFSIHRADCGEANGLTRFTSREVVVSDTLSDAAAAKTLCHELAHVRLHERAIGSMGRELIETEAESVAYIVSNAFGLDTAEYSISYVANWAQSSDLVKSTMQRVVTESHRIIEEAQLI